MLRETTAFGVRKTIAERRKLRREFAEVRTAFGKVTVKIGRLGGKVVQAAPEFESAKKLAAKTGVPVKQVYEAAVQAAKEFEVMSEANEKLEKLRAGLRMAGFENSLLVLLGAGSWMLDAGCWMLECPGLKGLVVGCGGLRCLDPGLDKRIVG